MAQQSTPQMYCTLATVNSQHLGQGLLGPAHVHYRSQATSLPSALSTMTLHNPTWHMDTYASSHLNFNASNLSIILDKRLFPSGHVGDGNSIPVINTSHNIILSLHRPLHLHNVLVTPNIIKNLIYVRQFTRDNNCTIEFDTFGFSVKDFLTRHILLRCDSSGDLYPVTKPLTSPTAFLSTSTSTWHQRLGHPGDEVLRSLVYRQLISCNKEKSSHIFHARQLDKHVAYLLLYVDAIILTASSTALLQHLIDSLHREFDMTDLGALNYFLGIFVVRHFTCSFLSQQKYALQLLSVLTWLIVTPLKHQLIQSPNWVRTGFRFRILLCTEVLQGGLQYLTFTHLDLSYAIQQICLYMHDPREPHLEALKHILRYVHGTLDLGLHLYASSTTSLVGYTGVDWAVCPSTRSVEAEYRGVANVVAETAWLRNHLH
uniref:Ribonuclease H-like domain-containing protein n=1 Tax=Tanacetum cinerariifolium TaxID=118510 RepID=A0A6L2MY84_TANCI|nr:ribonuclease H-like domain-containing protein [Tanacetum cinerariifolium]